MSPGSKARSSRLSLSRVAVNRGGEGEQGACSRFISLILVVFRGAEIHFKLLGILASNRKRINLPGHSSQFVERGSEKRNFSKIRQSPRNSRSHVKIKSGFCERNFPRPIDSGKSGSENSNDGGKINSRFRDLYEYSAEIISRRCRQGEVFDWKALYEV